MKILLSGSGSGGHIYPCIALYNYLKKNHEITLVIFKEIDKKIYDLNKIPYKFIENDFNLFKKIHLIKKIIKENNIEKVITFGGKNSFFIALATKITKVDLYIFEANAIMGKANKLNAFFAKKIFTNFKLNHPKELNVGSPNTYNIKKSKIKLFNNKKITLLFTMGSLGSSSVNNIIEKYIKNNSDYNIIYVTGNNVKSKIKEKDNLKIFNFYNPLTDLFNNADLIISRAGAATLAEIMALNKVSLIIPSPYVTNNHQEKNASYLYKEKAIELILEKDLTLTTLTNKIRNLTHNQIYYQTIKENTKKFNQDNNFKLIESSILK